LMISWGSLPPNSRPDTPKQKAVALATLKCSLARRRTASYGQLSTYLPFAADTIYCIEMFKFLYTFCYRHRIIHSHFGILSRQISREEWVITCKAVYFWAPPLLSPGYLIYRWHTIANSCAFHLIAAATFHYIYCYCTSDAAAAADRYVTHLPAPQKLVNFTPLFFTSKCPSQYRPRLTHSRANSPPKCQMPLHFIGWRCFTWWWYENIEASICCKK
jgi:hypothetical protein